MHIYKLEFRLRPGSLCVNYKSVCIDLLVVCVAAGPEHTPDRGPGRRLPLPRLLLLSCHWRNLCEAYTAAPVGILGVSSTRQCALLLCRYCFKLLRGTDFG